MKFQLELNIDDTFFPMRQSLMLYLRKRFPDLPEFENSFLDSEFAKIEDFIREHNNGKLISYRIYDFKNMWWDFGNTEYFTSSPHPGINDFCNAVYNLEGSIQIISARGRNTIPNYTFENAYEKTKNWLSEFNIKYDNLILSKDKLSHLLRLEKELKIPFKISVNDNLDELYSHVKALDNLTGILIDRTYNRKETIYEKQGRIIRVKNFMHVKSMLPLILQNSCDLTKDL